MFRKTVLSLVCSAALLGGAASTGSAQDVVNGNAPAAPDAYCPPGQAGAGGYPPGGGAGYGAYGATGYGAAAYGANFANTWGAAPYPRDCNRFYHYPYVYYPQNFYGSEYYKSSDSMYYRYPAEMQIPVYNRHWHNYYPSQRRYHWGHHFLTDVF
jgi:hypothetical protein